MVDAPQLPMRDLREQPVMLKGRRTRAAVGSEAFCFVLALAKRVEDKRLLKLIRAFLNAGVMENGLVSPSVEATPRDLEELHLPLLQTGNWSRHGSPV